MLLRSTSARMATDDLFSELAGGWPFMLKIGNSLTSAMKGSIRAGTSGCLANGHTDEMG